MKVGFIGLGRMGCAVARNILRAGHQLTVHDIRPEAADTLVAEGARWAASPAECAAHADCVITMVFGPAEVEAIVTGPDGLLSAARHGLVWVDMTTNRPSLLRHLATLLGDKGVSTIDAPVTGAIDGAIKGELTLFAGGSADLVESVRPILGAAGRIIFVGPLGSGGVVKLVTNQLWFIHAAAIGEAMVTARKAGVDLLALWEAMKSGAADSFVCRHDVPSIFAGHYDPSFTLDLCCKDLALIAGLAEEQTVDADLTRLVRAKFEAARRRYGGSEGELSVCRAIEQQAGVDLRVPGNWPKHWETAT
ncbi:NAD(P)-dependent oxidoreductase [Taklimakanibacter deserti]|uniref:NAD(P)-dependent oxidoreductase n=1 Tax=Taklimakanibacter deserti TaxID=2267839 RepID=UPI0013C501C9